MNDHREIIGVAVLYVVIEMIKWFYDKQQDQTNFKMASKYQRILDELYDWHKKEDENGRKLWYFPTYFHTAQDKMVEMLREISHNQEKTARLLIQLEKKIEVLSENAD